jgi:septal ring factor EnvC (AmiA/AmiB activator)
MSADDGFIELRLNRQEELAGENFWPSFTDIMTVVVMIFMMIMVVVLLHNMELVRDLQSSIEKERLAQEMAKLTGEEKDTLAVRLQAAENQLAELLARLRRSEDTRTQQAATLDQQSKRIDQQAKSLEEQLARLTALAGERDTLQRRSEQLSADLQSSSTQLSTTRQTAAQLEQSVAALRGREAELAAELAKLQASVSDKQKELDQSRDRLRASEQKLGAIQGDYSELKVKYDKLVRPARSPSGRYAVEVRYGKSASGYTIRYREGDSGDYAELARDKLDQRLAALKAKHPEGLYVRVVIPDGSGLSFSEAWEFTNHLHRNYDYYFQDSPLGAPETSAPANP